MSSIECLPNELVAFVASHLSIPRDLSSFARTSRKFYGTVNPILYREAVNSFIHSPLVWAATNGIAGTLEKLFDAGADPNLYFFDSTSNEKWKTGIAAARAKSAAQNGADPVCGGLAVASADKDHVQNIATGSPTVWSPATADSHAGSSGLSGQSGSWGRSSAEESDVSTTHHTPEIDLYSGPDLHVNPGGDTMEAEIDHLHFGPPPLDSPEPSSDREPLPVWDAISRVSTSDTGTEDSWLNGDADFDDYPYFDDELLNTEQTVQRAFTLLHLAARAGNDETVLVLLNHGARIDCASRNLCDCRHAAGLLNATESPGTQQSPEPSWTPLHIAICHSHITTAKLLLSRGASCMMETEPIPDSGLSTPPDWQNYGSTALHHAAASGHVELVRFLVDGGYQTDLEVRDARTLTPFYYAYAHDQWDSTAPALLDMGANINVDIDFFQPYCTITPLAEACRLGRFEIAQRLMTLGADTAQGFFASGSGHRKGLSPLHLCCMPSARSPNISLPAEGIYELGDKALQRMQTMKMLIVRGNPVHETNCSGETPLITAAQNRVVAAVKALIEAGADVNARNSVGKNVLMVALLGSPEAARTGDMFPGWGLSSLAAVTSILHELISAGARIEDVDPRGNNILHVALESGASYHRADILRSLLNYPAARKLVWNPNADGYPAFVLALGKGTLDNLDRFNILIRQSHPWRKASAEELMSWLRFALSSCGAGTERAVVHAILDLDIDGQIRSDPDMVFQLLREAKPGSTALAKALVLRGLLRPSREVATTLLPLALERHDGQLALHLLGCGADVNWTGGDKPSPLSLAIRDYEALDEISKVEILEVVQALLACGADIHRGRPSERPLDVAIDQVSHDLVARLLEGQPLGSDPRAAGAFYLHRALRRMLQGPLPLMERHHCFILILHTLIRQGADVAEIDDTGETPLSLFVQIMDTWNTTQWVATAFGSASFLSTLFLSGVDINRKTGGLSIASRLEDMGRRGILRQRLHGWPIRVKVVAQTDGTKQLVVSPYGIPS
ncbi:hypothetical protein VTK73DRAFT_2776 [Phialemonium thermophilum]|uniref:F-box domain-containing protein n=1 Tax=Phialemonium thermophilum TaxID=223376 RepID=A0ABR3X2X8_9PEZI